VGNFQKKKSGKNISKFKITKISMIKSRLAHTGLTKKKEKVIKGKK